MFFSNRLHNVALRGCLIASVALLFSDGLVAQESNQPNPQTEQSQPSTQQQQPNNPGIIPSTEKSEDRNVRSAQEIPKDDKANSPKYRSPCGDTDDDRQADLCEQQRMAAAAERSAQYTLWQTIIGAIGLVAVTMSLVFAGIGAFAARDAARAATTAANIARNAERPYFSPTNPELRGWDKVILETEDTTGVPLYVHFEILNSGKGMGFIKAFGIAHEICSDGVQGSKVPGIRDHFGRVSIRPDGVFRASVPFDIFTVTAEERLAIIGRSPPHKNIYVYGYIRYSDLFDIMRRTGFAFEFIPNIADPEKSSFVQCPGPLWYDKEEEPKHKPKQWPWWQFWRTAERAA